MINAPTVILSCATYAFVVMSTPVVGAARDPLIDVVSAENALAEKVEEIPARHVHEGLGTIEWCAETPDTARSNVSCLSNVN